MSFAVLKGHPRLTAVRSDLAALHLKDEIRAPRYAEGRELRVARPLVGMSDAPDAKHELINQLIFGEAFTVYDARDGWAWGQAADGYVGYVTMKGLRENAPAPTHRVAIRECAVRQDANVKARAVGGVPYGGLITIDQPGEEFNRMEGGGYVPTLQIRAIDDFASDWVAEAETFERTPYIWGGRNHFGVDCSGLIQISMQAAGLDCPRDADMQEAALGEILPDDTPRARGDLVFWKGHVGVLTDAETLFHANAHHMAAVYEPLAEAVARISAAGGGEPTSTRRLG